MTPEQHKAVKPTSVKLATPRSGAVVLNRVNGKEVVKELGNTYAAWETPEKGSPKRCVVRCDGAIKEEDTDQTSGRGGFPCAVNLVRYTIGGMTKTVKVDTVGQSALVVWAESIDVTAIWDQRRIDRLATLPDGTNEDTLPCSTQIVAATINSDQDDGDTGPADARWLDAIKVDATSGEGPDLEWSIHPIPDGARGLRFLDVLVNGAMTSVPGLTTIIAWSTDTFNRYPTGVVQLNTNGATDTSILIAPPLARYLFLAFPLNTISTFDIASWIEWIMAPQTLPGF